MDNTQELINTIDDINEEINKLEKQREAYRDKLRDAKVDINNKIDEALKNNNSIASRFK